MKKFLYLVISIALLGITSCGDDDPIDINDTTNESGYGSNNYTDPAITGGIQDVFYLIDNEYSDNSRGFMAVEIAGYLNLTAELKIAIGMAPDLYGIQISTSSSFPEGSMQKFSAKRMEDNRKFVVTVKELKENTTYYYRTFLTDAIYGETRSFTTESYETVASKMKIASANATYVGANDAQVSLGENNTGIACALDKSLLTADNIKNGTSSGIMLSTSGSLSELASGTTYYYCAYRIIYGENTGMWRKPYYAVGEIKSFTTEGYKAEELAKQVTATASLNESTQMWSVSIQSSLASTLSGKSIKYGVTHKMTTSFTGPDYYYGYNNTNHNYKVEWMYRYTGDDWRTNAYAYLSGGRNTTLYGAVVFEKSVYATGNGSSYKASIDNPYYNGTYYIDENGERNYYEDWWAQWRSMNIDAFMYYRDRVNLGIAADVEIECYEELGGDDVFNGETAYAEYVKCYLQVFVEIDGIRYVVKEQEGKVRVPNAKDNPLDGNYPYNNKDDDGPKFDPDAQA